MEKEAFSKLITKLDSFASKVEALKQESSKPSSDWTVTELTAFRERAASLQSTMDKCFMTDLYHVIGMGKLSGSQLATYTKAIKRLGDSRSHIKWLASLPVIKVGELSTESEYVTQLGGVKLAATN